MKHIVGRQKELIGKPGYPGTALDKEFMQDVLQSLADFGAEQLEFLGEGLDMAAGYLEKESRFSKAYLVGLVTRQMAFDMGVLERVVDQRRDVELKRSVLRRADAMASDALNRGFLPDAAWPLTYFEKSAMIRVTPYAPAALIGIPYSALPDGTANGQSDDMVLAAVAHEAGHYVYWHGQSAAGQPFCRVLYEYLAGNEGFQLPRKGSVAMQPLYAHWLEELFADVYAAMVGGLATAMSIQQVVSDNLPARMFHDDGEHPLAVLRPYIYTRVLRRMAIEEATSLDDLWQDWQNQQGLSQPTDIKIVTQDVENQPGDPVTKSFDEVRQEVSILVDQILTQLTVHQGSQDNCWVKSADIRGTEDTLESRIETALTGKIHNLPAPGETPKFNGKWRARGQELLMPLMHGPDGIATRRHEIKRDYNANNKAEYKSIENRVKGWDVVAQAKGWVSGPGDDPYPNRT